MGEVGANATETTAAPTADSNNEPKENGEVNGTSATAPAAQEEDTTITVKQEKTVDEKSAAEEANGTGSEGDDAIEKKATEAGKEQPSPSSAAPKSDATNKSQQAGTEPRDEEEEGEKHEQKKKKSNSDKATAVAPSTEEQSHKTDDSCAGGGGNGLGTSAEGKSDLASRPDGETKRCQDTDGKKVSRPAAPETEAMDLDDEDSDAVVAVEATNGTQNGKESVKVASKDSKAVTTVSKEEEEEEVTEIPEDEPMEVDGENESVATNGHKEATTVREEAEEDAVERAEKLTRKKPAGKESEKEEAPLENDEDDKPVSINSDSECEEDPQHIQAPARESVTTTTATKAAAPSNVILVDEGGLAKLGAVGGDGAPMGAKSTAGDSVPSNGVANVSTSNQNGDCDGDLTILSDKEDDCVVIEDDEGDSDESMPSAANTTRGSNAVPHQQQQARKSEGPISLVAGGGTLNAATIAAMQQQLGQGSMDDEEDDDDDIEEIIDDPLSLNSARNLSMSSGRSSIGGYQSNATNFKNQGQKSLLMSNSATGGGKDPTLVLIDTNAMINNGGSPRTSAVNLSAVGSPTVNSNAANLLAKASNAGILANANVNTGGQYNSRSLLNAPGIANPTSGGGGIVNHQGGAMLGKAGASALTPVTPLLPALTDDMFVLEAPSFIVPYIYEKPPEDNLRDIVDELEESIKEMRKKLVESGVVPPAPDQPANEAGTSAAAQKQQQPDESGKKDAAPGSIYDKDADKNKYNKKRKRNNDDDDDWDELETSTDDEASDEEQKTKVLIKEAKADIEAIKEHIISPSDKDDLGGGGGSSTGGGANDPKKSENYFENPLGKFFMNIGINLVQEFVQTDLLRQQKRKRDREGKPSPSTQLAINSLMKNLEQSKENNKPYKFEMKRCEYCPFKSESALVMAHHYETPHMRNFIFKCNFCAYETRPPHDILYHMEAVHNIKGRMEKALSYHHCPNCPFEDNGKSKLARHAVACAKKFRPELNLNPPIDWEPPAKIPRIKPKHGLVGTATAYQAMTAQQQKNIALANQQRINQQQVVSSPVHLQQQQHLAHSQIQQQQLAGVGQQQQQHLGLAGANAAAATLNNVAALANLSPTAQAVAIRARAVGGTGSVAGTGGRAPAIIPSPTGITGAGGGGGGGVRAAAGGGVGGVGTMNANALAASAAAIRNTLAGAGMVIPNNLQLSASALAAAAAGGFSKYLPNASSMKATKTAQAPSISITPLPRQSASNNAANMSNIAGALSKLQAQGTSAVKPGQNPTGGKMAFVVCEICDGYIKDLDQLRNHMQWIHKVKIHPKMIYNRPPLNCQKCQYRFFTDQGLERHLLGSHGLVTSSMQEAANKGKDAGRCPVCGRVYQWKLLNHVSRDHNMTLKPAHLSYKCTVCTATFGMYKQFESHVYSAHSTVAKKSTDGSKSSNSSKGGGGGQQQSSSGMGGGSSSSGAGLRNPFGGGDSLLKPLKINDEITIIPQPTSNSKMAKTIELESHVIGK
uniref:MOG interacting and ectopic P-granules protein 1 n=1 Tax=Anopheles stephensi TaxID=30069 RepID=A0A182Y2K6_ANOST